MTTPPVTASPGTPDLRDCRQPLDMAAPLIGSTAAMQQLRGIIERVACTDFTILLEGASDPQ